MKDKNKIKKQLVNELIKICHQITGLEISGKGEKL